MNTKKESILQKINPKFLKMTPKLNVTEGSVINLDDENSFEDGPKKLMMKFIMNQNLSERYQRNCAKKDVDMTVSSAKYNDNGELCELVSELLTFPSLKNNDDELFSYRPGRKLQELKIDLQNKMSAKWEAEYRKKMSEIKLNKKGKNKEKCSEDSNDEVDDNESLSGRDKSMQLSEDSNMLKDASENDNNPISDDEDAAFDGDDESVDSSDEDDDDVDDDAPPAIPKATDSNSEEDKIGNECYGEDESDGWSCVPAYQPGGGLLYGGSELTQCKEDLPQIILSPSLRLSINESPNSKFQNSSGSSPKIKETTFTDQLCDVVGERKKLFSHSQDSLDLNDAFDLCSGKFPEPGDRVNSQFESQSFIKNIGEDYSEDVSVEKDEDSSCSMKEKFEDSPKDRPKTKKRIMVLEESEPEDNNELITNEDSNSGAVTTFLELEDDADTEDRVLIKNKKNRTKLKFSDDEDETNCLETDGKSDSSLKEASDDEEEDCDKRSVLYDSEENEIINPKEFFEKEAELSGSEWSGDEDERGLDHFDIEEGDADNLDNNQVRSQLEKIHIRRILDDDAREVRLIQELLFEDGDLHSDGKRRDRRFKWKNLGNFDEKETNGNPMQENGSSSEEDCTEEEQRRKLRHEKELFLMELKKDGDVSSEDEISNANFQKLKMSTAKTSILSSSLKGTNIEIYQNVESCTEVIKPYTLPNPRGSFLTRNGEFLSKLAKTTGSVTDTLMGPKNSKNFIFAAKSPEKPNAEKSTMSKRQLEYSEPNGRREKKKKLQTPEIDTGPSILDLLI